MTILRLRADDLEWRTVDDEVVVLEVTSGAYLTLNESGGLLFRRLIDGATSDELVEAILGEYDTTVARASADVDEFVGLLRAHDLPME